MTTTYLLREEGYDFDRVDADSAEAALDELTGEDLGARGYYPTEDGTVWVTIHAISVEDADDRASRTYAIDPPEPECPCGEHDWQSPHELVGGLRQNPGVYGHGGGVIMTRVCVRCGCERVTDTWAQDRCTGRQGLESVRYEPAKYADEIEGAAVVSALCVVQARSPNAWGGWGEWRADEIGENPPRSREECERDCESLRGLGREWAEAEYRVIEVQS